MTAPGERSANDQANAHANARIDSHRFAAGASQRLSAVPHREWWDAGTGFCPRLWDHLDIEGERGLEKIASRVVDADCFAYLIHSDGDGVPPITAILADDSY
jgi:hypothetical protein